MNDLRFAIIGAGFWSKYQLAAWAEVKGARCVAIYNRTKSKAENLAAEFGGLNVYEDIEKLFRTEAVDFVDIVTDPCSHEHFVSLAAGHGVPAICQKPLAESLEAARRMVARCEQAGVPLLVHENWRWQTPLRALRGVIEEGRIGRPFRAYVNYSNSFPVFENQPFLKRLDRFILNDVGTHVLDAARMLFGEMSSLYCTTKRVHPEINGEDVATLLLISRNGVTITCALSYASRTEHERFPQTFVEIEGSLGSVVLGPDYCVRVTTASGTNSCRVPPPRYNWADPAYDVVHASIVPCHENLLGSLRGENMAETTGSDNLRTLELVDAAYRSAASDECVHLVSEGSQHG